MKINTKEGKECGDSLFITIAFVLFLLPQASVCASPRTQTLTRSLTLVSVCPHISLSFIGVKQHGGGQARKAEFRIYCTFAHQHKDQLSVEFTHVVSLHIYHKIRGLGR